MKRDDADIDRILARGYLGSPQHDQILRNVLERTGQAASAPRARRWWLMALVPGTAMAAGLAAWLVVARPTPAPFVSKGTLERVASVDAEVSCGHSGTRDCRIGDTLMFTVNTAVTSGYLGAYAEPVGSAPGERIWYFPTAAGTMPVVAAGHGTKVVPDGIRIGPEHRPGVYRVTVFIATRPLQQSAVDAAPADVVRGRSVFDLRVND